TCCATTASTSERKITWARIDRGCGALAPSPRRLLLAGRLAQHVQIEPFHLFAGPRRLAQKFQAGVDTGVMREAAHRHPHCEIGPSVMGLEGANDGLQRHAVQAVAWLHRG